MECKKKNGGFSLIELIVTIAIMAVVVGGSVSIYYMIKTSRLTSMSETLDNAVSDLRTASSARAENYRMRIYNDGNAYIAVIEKGQVQSGGTTNWIEYDKTQISTHGKIYCYDDSTGARLELTSGSSGYTILLSINKSDKSFSEISCYANSDTSFLSPKKLDDNEIYVEYAGKQKCIKLLETTGKHYIK
jgi:prepilin-type N-terminal cleavage/methylation domain-containing protein